MSALYSAPKPTQYDCMLSRLHVAKTTSWYAMFGLGCRFFQKLHRRAGMFSCGFSTLLSKNFHDRPMALVPLFPKLNLHGVMSGLRPELDACTRHGWVPLLTQTPSKHKWMFILLCVAKTAHQVYHVWPRQSFVPKATPLDGTFSLLSSLLQTQLWFSCFQNWMYSMYCPPSSLFPKFAAGTQYGCPLLATKIYTGIRVCSPTVYQKSCPMCPFFPQSLGQISYALSPLFSKNIRK
jgi:hypothetical protein